MKRKTPGDWARHAKQTWEVDPEKGLLRQIIRAIIGYHRSVLRKKRSRNFKGRKKTKPL